MLCDFDLLGRRLLHGKWLRRVVVAINYSDLLDSAPQYVYHLNCRFLGGSLIFQLGLLVHSRQNSPIRHTADSYQNSPFHKRFCLYVNTARFARPFDVIWQVSNCAYCGKWFNVKPYCRGIRKWRLIRMTYSDRISLRLDTLTICSNWHIDHSTLWNMPSNIAAARLLLLQRNHEIIHVSSSLSHRPFRILARASLAQLCSAPRNSA